MAVLAALRGDYSDVDIHWVIEQAKLKSKSSKGIGGLILSMLRRGQRPDQRASLINKVIHPAAIEHLRHALDQLGLGRDEKYAGFIDRLARRWAPVTDHLLRHAYPGASASDLLNWCLEQDNEHGSIDPACGKPGLIMSGLKSRMGKIVKDWDAAVASCPQGTTPTFMLPTGGVSISTGVGIILTRNPDIDCVLGPEVDPWSPGKRDELIIAQEEAKAAAEKKMEDTGVAPDGTPYVVVKIRRVLDKLRTCDEGMIQSHLNALNALRHEVETNHKTDTSRGRARTLDDEWMQTITRETEDVFSDLADRELVTWDESGQTAGPRQTGAECVTESVENLQAIDPDATAAAVASIAEIPTYISPGLCVGLNDPRAQAGHDYLTGRGIDPLEATRVYGVSMCIEGNPLVCKGGMLGRLIFPVTKDGLHVGWQARLAFEPQQLDKDRSFKFLRWYTMPGVWRQDYLLGYDQSKGHEHAILVEGPTDLVKQGSPCIASLGQTLSLGQARLIRAQWDHVVIVGNHQKKADGTENAVQVATTRLLRTQDFKSVHLIKLPHGDPGDWDRGEFGKYVAEHIRQSRGQSMETRAVESQ
jgi:hypothetical protein